MIEFKLLLLLLIANGTPVLAHYFLDGRLDLAIDFGHTTSQGRPWLGPAKTFRGVLAALLASTIAAPLMGFSWDFGIIMGGLAMTGDLVSSFIKRRIGLTSSSQASGLDQIPESLLPLIYCVVNLDLGWYSVLGVTLAFWLSEIVLSQLLYKLGLRRHPY